MRDMFYFGSNLKMYKNIGQTVEFLTGLSGRTRDIDRGKTTIFVIPSYTSLDRARSTVKKEDILLGAQNMHWEEEGQYTGEISPSMLAEVGVDIVEIGHSERRHVMGETDLDINKKVLSALSHNFKALLCVGETMQQKEFGLSGEVIATQLKIGLSGVKYEHLSNLWVAYEPVWAIGVSGVPASPEYADEKHGFIKSVLSGLFADRASDIPVLYGGSVNQGNCGALAAMPNIDGLFVGRAAWSAVEFDRLLRDSQIAFQKKRRRLL